MDQRPQVATKSVHVLRRDRQYPIRGNGRVDGVATLIQDLQCRRTGQLINRAHHRLGGKNSRRRRKAHPITLDSTEITNPCLAPVRYKTTTDRRERRPVIRFSE